MFKVAGLKMLIGARLHCGLLALAIVLLFVLAGCRSPTIIRGLRLPAGAERQFAVTIDGHGAPCTCGVERIVTCEFVPVSACLGPLAHKLHMSVVQRIEFTCAGGWQQVEAHFHFWAKSHNYAEQTPASAPSQPDFYSRVRVYTDNGPSAQRAAVLCQLSESGSLMQPHQEETGRERFVLIMVRCDG